MTDGPSPEIDSEHPPGREGKDGPLPGRADTSSWSTIRRIRVAFGVLVVILVVSGLAAYWQILRIERDVTQIVEIEEPLEQAVLEMEINVGETARAVLDYILDHEERDLDRIKDSESDFEDYARVFERLAETEEERELGREVARIYREFKTLGDEITAMAKRRFDDLAVFHKDVMTIDALIDDKLQPAIDRSAAGALTKLEAALEMEINIFEAFAAIEGYILRPDPVLRQKIADSKADFEWFEAQYRGTNITADEKRSLDMIDKAFSEAVMAGNEIIALTDAMRGKLETFEADLEEIDRILDDEIQPLIHIETIKAAEDAKESVRTAFLILVLVGGVGLVAGAVLWVFTQGMVGSLRRLVAGAERIGGGDTGHRIDTGTGDEFGYLADAFNRMVENLTRAEDTAVATERRLDAAIESISEGFVLYGADERLVLCNSKYLEFNAIVADVLVPGARLEDVVRAAAERGQFEAAAVKDKEEWIRSRLRHYRTESGAREFLHHDGRWFLSSEHRTAEGSIVGIRTDITELKKAGEKLKNAYDEMERRVEERTVDLERANQTKSEFLATMSHELRTPLNAILGFSEIIKDQVFGPVDVPAYVEYGADIHNSGRYLLRLINDLLDLSKIEAGKLELDTEALNVLEAISEAIGVIEPMAEKGRISLVTGIDRDLPPINADRRAFHQMMLNLLSNAIKFTPEGGRVEVLGKSTAKELQIAVADTGVGISPKHIKKVLEPFGQLRDPLISGLPGTGLGLPIVQSLMELHGGRFELESEKDRGTTATLVFPLDPPAPAPVLA